MQNNTNSVHPKPPSYNAAMELDLNHSQSPPYPASDQTGLPPYSYQPEPYAEPTRPTDLPGYSPPNVNENVYPPPAYNPSLIQPTLPHVAAIAEELPGFTTREAFQDKNVVRGFLRKVYAILFLQLLLTVGIVAIFTFVPEVREFFRTRTYFVIIFGVLVLVFYILTSCSGFGRRLQRRWPENIVLVVILTLLMAVFTGTIASYFSTEAVVFAFIMTAGTCLLISVLSLSESFFFLEWFGGYLAITFLILVGFAIVSAVTYQQTWYLQVVWGFIAAFIFGIFLAYDTNQLIDSEDSDLTGEDYVAGAIQIYVDVVMIFIIILIACAGGGSGGQ